MHKPQPKQVLLVEDNTIMAGVLRRNLQQAGFEATIARNGVEGCEACQNQTFDLVVTDFQMARMNGVEFIAQLRQSAGHENVPVIFLTGKGLELDTEKLRRELGVREVMFKPFSPRCMIDVIEACLADSEHRISVQPVVTQPSTACSQNTES